MDPIKEVSDPPGSTNPSLGTKQGQRRKHSMGRKGKAVTGRKGHLENARPWEMARQLGTPSIPLTEGKWW